MKNNWTLRRRLPRRAIFGLAFMLIVSCFATWFLIRYFTIGTEFDIVSIFEMPTQESLDDIERDKHGDFAVAFDGKVIYEDNFDEVKRPTASTAKMILGLAIMSQKPFEVGERGEEITITKDFYEKYLWYVRNGGSNTPVFEGQKMSEYDALMSVFLPSSNNMADSLAIWAFSSLDEYQEYATKMLQEFGIRNTVIGEDASGFSDTTMSTPADLAKVGYRVLKNPVLKDIVGTKEYNVGGNLIRNTNKILGESGIIGVKTGYIGDASGYCLVSGYEMDGHIVTLALLGAETREESFNESLALISNLKQIIKKRRVINAGDIVGYYNSWWTGEIEIRATTNLDVVSYDEAGVGTTLVMDGENGKLKVVINGLEYEIDVKAEGFINEPSFVDKLKRVFGWHNPKRIETEGGWSINESTEIENFDKPEDVVGEKIEEKEPHEELATVAEDDRTFTSAKSDNCTIPYGKLMLINPNFIVDNNFISARRSELVSISSLYGIVEGNPYNGDNLLDAEAAAHINDMVRAYESAYPGHTLETRSCFRSAGTNCGRLCAATGTSDHHTGLTCDLLDPAYGTSLDTDTYHQHLDWQWLRANSYKYGFIDRFPEAWAGGPMSAPINVDENGSTGLYETWHYRYVGIEAATEIATGVYNNGAYDSLEHYLKMQGLVSDLKNGKCE